MTLELKEQLRTEAKMFAFLLVLLALPVFVYSAQQHTVATQTQAYSKPTLTIRPITPDYQENGTWNIAIPPNPHDQVPLVIELASGASHVSSSTITITYDPDIFSFDSTKQLTCTEPDTTPSKLPFKSKTLISRSLETGKELGILTFTCGLTTDTTAVSIPIEPQSTVIIATLFAKVRKPTTHTTIGFLSTEKDILSKTMVTSLDETSRPRTIDAIISTHVSPDAPSLSLKSDASYFEVDTPFTVSVQATTVQPVSAVDVVILYDPSVLQPTGIFPGDVFPGYLGLDNESSEVFVETPGKLRFSVLMPPDSPIGISGHDIHIADITFVPKASAQNTSLLLEYDTYNSRNDSNMVSSETHEDILTVVSHMFFTINED